MEVRKESSDFFPFCYILVGRGNQYKILKVWMIKKRKKVAAWNNIINMNVL